MTQLDKLIEKIKTIPLSPEERRRLINIHSADVAHINLPPADKDWIKQLYDRFLNKNVEKRIKIKKY